MISSEVLVAVLSLLGTAFGSVTGIMAANKLTNYRIAELEKKKWISTIRLSNALLS